MKIGLDASQSKISSIGKVESGSLHNESSTSSIKNTASNEKLDLKVDTSVKSLHQDTKEETKINISATEPVKNENANAPQTKEETKTESNPKPAENISKQAENISKPVEDISKPNILHIALKPQCIWSHCIF